MLSPRLLTLTLASTDQPLSDQIDRLLACSRQLRRLAKWRHHVNGGVQTIEVTWHAGKQQWHPHLHLVVDGSYFPQPQLKALWKKVTGDSFIVDVRKVHDAKQAGRYVASYLVKHGAVASWPHDQIREYASAMHGRRMVQTFGSSHGVELDPKDEEDLPRAVEPVANVREIEDAADAGCPAAMNVRRYAWSLGWPWNLVWPSHSEHAVVDEHGPDVEEVKAMVMAAALEIRVRSLPPPKPSSSDTPLLPGCEIRTRREDLHRHN